MGAELLQPEAQTRRAHGSWKEGREDHGTMGVGTLRCSWGPWVSPALGREPVTRPHTLFFLPIGLCL